MTPLAPMLAAALLLAGGAGPEPAPGRPRLLLETPSYDFGKIDPSSVVTHRFRVRNGGAAPLTLGEPRPSCGCTSTVTGQRTLAPGESTELEVTFHADRTQGPVKKTVEVPSDDPEAATRILTFQAEVLPGVYPSTGVVSFPDLAREDRRKASVKLQIDTGQAVRLAGIDRPESPWLEVTTREEGNALWVDFALQAGRLPEQLAGEDTVTLHPAGLKPADLPISVYWQRVPPITLHPAAVFWERPAGRALHAPVVLRHPQGRPFRILSVRSTSPLVRVTGVDGRASSSKVIAVHLAATARPGNYDEKLYLTVDTPGRPELEIPVGAELR